MEVTCPLCKQPNKVAGMYLQPYVSAQGNNDNNVICGFCGRKFDAYAAKQAAKFLEEIKPDHIVGGP